MYTLYEYPKCSTCKKAKAWLDQQGVKYQAIDIKATPPSSEQLAKWMKETGLPVRRFFNTSGVLYREQGLKDLVDSFSIEEASQRLGADGMLIKRPILLKDNTFLTNGFKEADYEGVLGK
ncbi:arsenate reductase family protein [Enterococcus faecalis]